jgi:hypothetical protein
MFNNLLDDFFYLSLPHMTYLANYNNLDLIPRGYKLNPDWERDFREDQDKVTRVINKILDIELGDYLREDTVLSEIYFTKYWGGWNYCLVYKIKERYHNVNILVGTILQSTDEVLKWYDLTTKFNFNIIIATPSETFRFTYLDLLYEYVTMPDGNGRFLSMKVLFETHPRIQQMKEWVTRYREYDRVTRKTVFSNHPYSRMDRDSEQGELLKIRYDVDYKEKEPMNRYIDGRLQMSIPIEERINNVTKVSVITRLMNKLKLKSR